MNVKSKLESLIQLTRINRPTGIWLLFLPCLFGIFLSHKTNLELKILPILLLFFLGSVIMRSAGCIINDIADRNFDKKVKRTKSRPIANNNLNLIEASALLAILLVAGLVILMQFNILTIKLGFGALLLIALYPLTKRFSYYPQLFLGITFNFGILLASSAINNEITLPILALYVSAISWTVIYDTIYAYQDIEDDIKIGVKSSAIKFGAKPQKILYGLIIVQISLLALAGFLAELNLVYYFMIYIALFHLLCQVKTCDFKDSKSCLRRFKSNVIVGLIIFLAIALG
jgi:4-hydroxybenzoate polyprenyltransferase